MTPGRPDSELIRISFWDFFWGLGLLEGWKLSHGASLMPLRPVSPGLPGQCGGGPGAARARHRDWHHHR